LPDGAPYHDTFAWIFELMDPQEFEAAFRHWAEKVMPSASPQVVVKPADGQQRPAKGK
tara:strand:- start:642 stop:815 length:174 start_codon:yes stop_codon:yes gene_type:complete